MRHLLLSAPLALALMLAIAPPAGADPLTAQDEANARFQTGLKYYDARDFESARLAFTQAYAVLQRPGILLNLGLSELYSNRPIEALAHLATYAKDTSSPAEKRERAKKAIDEALKKTGHLAVKTAPEARVEVDGTPASPSSSGVIHVMPGAHAVEARLGDKIKSATVDARAGETTNVDLAFDKESAGGVAPIAPAPVAPRSSETDPRFTEPPHEPARSETFWGVRSISGLALVGLGAVGLGVGLVSKGQESSQREEADRLAAGLPAADACTGASSSRPECRDLADAVSSRDSAASRAGTFFVLGGVTAGVGAALVLSAVVWPHRRESAAAGAVPRLIPVTGPTHAGVLFTSTF